MRDIDLIDGHIAFIAAWDDWTNGPSFATTERMRATAETCARSIGMDVGQFRTLCNAWRDAGLSCSDAVGAVALGVKQYCGLWLCNQCRNVRDETPETRLRIMPMWSREGYLCDRCQAPRSTWYYKFCHENVRFA